MISFLQSYLFLFTFSSLLASACKRSNEPSALCTCILVLFSKRAVGSLWCRKSLIGWEPVVPLDLVFSVFLSPHSTVRSPISYYRVLGWIFLCTWACIWVMKRICVCTHACGHTHTHARASVPFQVEERPLMQMTIAAIPLLRSLSIALFFQSLFFFLFSLGPHCDKAIIKFHCGWKRKLWHVQDP